MRFFATLFLSCALLPALVFAQESVCLKTGFCLEAESHMIADGMLVVQSGQGTLQFPVDQVDGITALPVVALKHILPPPPALDASPAGPVDLLIRAALQEGLEPEFVRSVAMIESGLHQEAVSPKGAVGLMQLMPRTADQLGVDAQQSEQNALGGAAFLRQMLIRYNGNSALALAAYNAGPGAVDKYKGVPPYPETRRYVIKVLAEYARQQQLQGEKNLLAEKARQPNGSGMPSAEALRAETAKLNADHSAVR
jgi:hypothetical protein